MEASSSERPYIPDKPGLYLRKDYAAACPQQHLAYLRCLQDNSGIPGTRCLEELGAFQQCVAQVLPPHKKGETPPAVVAYWRNLKNDPYWIGVVEQLKSLTGGWCSSSSGSGSSSSSHMDDNSSNSSSSSPAGHKM